MGLSEALDESASSAGMGWSSAKYGRGNHFGKMKYRPPPSLSLPLNRHYFPCSLPHINLRLGIGDLHTTLAIPFVVVTNNVTRPSHTGAARRVRKLLTDQLQHEFSAKGYQMGNHSMPLCGRQARARTQCCEPISPFVKDGVVGVSENAPPSVDI
jgi:hypothetical protein